MDLTRILGIKVTFVPLYHQQTNGAVERQHRTLKESIKASLIQMGDKHKSAWMSQLPFTLLGRRIAFQPDLGTSSALLTLGSSPAIPGLIFPDTPPTDNHTLLKSLQVQASQEPHQMSRHRPPNEIYMPEVTQNATHVYIQIDKPDNLGQKYLGPFPIASRPSPSTINVLVGYTKQGLPRLELHSWDRVRVAHMREGAQVATRPELGRRKVGTSDPDDDASHTDDQNKTATSERLITQPRFESSRSEDSAAGADFGDFGATFQTESASPSHHSGPPPNPAFRSKSQQKQTALPRTLTPSLQQPGTSTPGVEPGRVLLSPETSSRLAPPVTKGAPSSSATSADQSGQHIAHDHDYTTTWSPHLTDHNYYARPPPGFSDNQSHGRPQRNRNLPTKYSDYVLQ